MIRKQRQSGRVFLSALATSLLAGGIMLGVTPAHAATAGSFDVPDQTVAQGGTISATLTPTGYGSSYDYAYFCDTQEGTDKSDPTKPGYSVVLALIPQTGNPVWVPAGLTEVSQTVTTTQIFYELSGSGAGNITPFDNSITGATSTLTFKLPSDIPAGVYQVTGGCMSPNNWTVLRDASQFNVKFGKITVTAAPAPQPAPQPDAGATQTEQSASLAKTGVTSANSAIYGSVAAAALALGIASVLMRRRSRS